MPLTSIDDFDTEATSARSHGRLTRSIWMVAFFVMILVVLQSNRSLLSSTSMDGRYIFLFDHLTTQHIHPTVLSTIGNTSASPPRPTRNHQTALSKFRNFTANKPLTSEGSPFVGNKSVSELFEENWPRQKSCRFNLSFYVYDDLPWNMTTDFEHRIRRSVQTQKRIHENVATEWALLQLFRTSPCRTNDPDKAQLYFVPYMHFTHCEFHEGYAVGCGQVPDSEMKELFGSLRYYNQTTRDRHVFLNAYDSIMSKKQMSSVHLKLTSGPMYRNMDGPGSIIVPIFHDEPRYQPSVLMSYNETWWTRPRKYSFVSFFGKRNPRMKRRQPRRFREYFWNSLNQSSEKTIGGLPYISMMLEKGMAPVDYYGLYREAVMCPILPGDTCWQRRFFDVIRNGCLPLVLEWPLETGGRSWHEPNSCPVEETYPFFKGLAGSNSSIVIDYDSFVVRAPGNLKDESNVTSLMVAMEELLADPEKITRRQRRMMEYAPLFTFGLGNDAHIYDDGFAGIMRVLERHVHHR